MTNISLIPVWKGKTAVCIASGPSLTKDQVIKTKGLRTIVVNDCYKIAPWADILYACDRQWWDWHDGAKEFKGYKLQHGHNKTDWNGKDIPYPGIDSILSSGTHGFDERLDRIRTGGNSGYQALHIAMHLGASKILLLGYDMGSTDKSHWFGEHPTGKGCDTRYDRWIKEFPALFEVSKNKGVQIINCTPSSRLDCFNKMTIDEALMF